MSLREALILANGGGGRRGTPPPASAINWAGKNMYVFGDSIGYGNAASDVGSTRAHSWPNIVSANKGASLIRVCTGGETMQNATSPTGRRVYANSDADAAIADPDFAAGFIALGINDIGCNDGNHTVVGYKAALKSAIQYMVAGGIMAPTIVVISPYWCSTKGFAAYVTNGDCATPADYTRAAAYVQAAAEAASEEGTVYIDVYTPTSINPNRASFMSGDGLHPNDTGHANIASLILVSNFLP